MNLVKREYYIEKVQSYLGYVQVCYLLQSDGTMEREFGNLRRIRDNFPKMVICMDEIAARGSYDGIQCVHIKDFLETAAE